jgi:hypothetical protein
MPKATGSRKKSASRKSPRKSKSRTSKKVKKVLNPSIIRYIELHKALARGNKIDPNREKTLRMQVISLASNAKL